MSTFFLEIMKTSTVNSGLPNTSIYCNNITNGMKMISFSGYDPHPGVTL